ncbi:Elongation factor Ts, mitochondrial [Aphelenchoides besseyi]|nr:Elongation factor Ts, mitochondrial [Aphelenchoides besseyi]
MFRRLASIRLYNHQIPQLARWFSTEQRSVSKESLSKLRKATGYSYTNCRKALLQFGDDNLVEAERWLRDLAKKEGWAKATKLSSRQASQGLVGVLTNDNLGVIVELKCETDFVSRSSDFKDLIEEISYAALDWSKNRKSENNSNDEVEIWPADKDIEEVETQKGRPIKEAVAMTVGKLGENISIGRIEIVRSKPGIELHGNTHPREKTDKIAVGQFASILALTRNANASKFPSERLAEQINQHIIGMNPHTVGSPATKKETEHVPLSTDESVAKNVETDELNDFADVQSTRLDEDETQLLRQSFMLNPSQSVNDYLTSHGAHVIWFARKELGESVGDKS